MGIGWEGPGRHTPHCRADEVLSQLNAIRSQLAAMDEKLEKIMTEDSAVAAVAADVEQDVSQIDTALTTIQAALAAAQADSVQPATLQQLQAAQAALDSLSANAVSDASGDQPAAPVSNPPVTAPPADSTTPVTDASTPVVPDASTPAVADNGPSAS